MASQRRSGYGACDYSSEKKRITLSEASSNTEENTAGKKQRQSTVVVAIVFARNIHNEKLGIQSYETTTYEHKHQSSSTNATSQNSSIYVNA